MPGAVGFPLGFAASVAVTLLTVAMGATRHPLLSLAALVLVVVAIAALTRPAAAYGTAAVAWALQDGFVLGRQGDLVRTGQTWPTFAVLLTAALVTTAVAALVRRRRSPQPAVPLPRSPARRDRPRPVAGRPV